MAKTTTSQKPKNDVVGKAKGASNGAPNTGKPAAKNTKVEAPADTTGDPKTEEKPATEDPKEDPANENAKTETDPTEEAKDNGLPFTADADGMIEVCAKDRAGTSVYGATGEVITFDENGCAKVCLEEALHFAKMPGFEFKE